MTYENLETRGTIKSVLCTELYTKDNQPGLVSPDQIQVTRVEIDQRPEINGSSWPELLGEFGPEYVGKKIRLVSSYDKPEEGLKRFTQQVFIDDQLEFDRNVVLRRD